LRRETDSNFGFNLPWWDRLFGTYRPAPAAGHNKMTIGLPIFRNVRELRIDRLLSQPFRNDPGDPGGGGGQSATPAPASGIKSGAAAPPSGNGAMLRRWM
jgi:hypothetical protein